MGVSSEEDQVTTIADVKTRHIHNDAGILTGFEVGNGLLTRTRACRLVQQVPGAIVSRRPRSRPELKSGLRWTLTTSRNAPGHTRSTSEASRRLEKLRRLTFIKSFSSVLRKKA